MQIVWSHKSKEDIQRLFDFLYSANPVSAAEMVVDIRRYVALLPTQPRLGRNLPRYDPREIRSGIIGRYEIRYEIKQTNIIILRVWHTRENRSKG